RVISMGAYAVLGADCIPWWTAVLQGTDREDQRLAMSSCACFTRSAPICLAHLSNTGCVTLAKASICSGDSVVTVTPWLSISFSRESSVLVTPLRAMTIS